LGTSLLEPMKYFLEWVLQNRGGIEAAREKFDKRG
jgi:hypothetical protein